MNLFWKHMFGGMISTSKLEKKEAALAAKAKRYYEVEKSMELAEYNDLRKIVKSADFKQNKKMLQNRKYKDTEEYRNWTKFQKLSRNVSLQSYFDTLSSADLNSYLEFRNGDQYEQLSNKKAVKASEFLQRIKAYERSKAYKNYMRYNGSFIVDEYQKLKKLVATEEFQKNNAFWSNQKRWETTKDCQMDIRFYELSKNSDIVFYESTNPNRFQKIISYKSSFSDEFDWNTITASRWDFGFHYKNPHLMQNHSFANEQQANNSGKNVSVVNGILHLETVKENCKAPAWDVKKGFVEKVFEYTSDVMQTANTFRQKGGVFRAKLRCSGKIHHAFWLGGDNKLPHVNIFHYNGKYITLGNASTNVFEQVNISGINPGQFYIYTLLWTEKEMVWYINNVEVFRTSANLPKEELYLAFSSFISNKQKAHPGMLEVDWVKAYTF